MTTTNTRLSYKLEVLLSEAIEKLELELTSSDHKQSRYKSNLTEK
jgi:hypothetical protein